ncbi:MAG: pseudouridine synthase [Gammaproteobacteria bacterium]
MNPGKSQAAVQLLLFNKPFGVLCQFSSAHGRASLGDYIPVPDVYPAGRLDQDSEGLLLLTNHGPLQARLSDPRHGLWKSYWAQVEGEPDEAALEQLREGVILRDGPTRPARVRRLVPAPQPWPREPPIRVRRHIPDSWLELQLQEGRNRQVRRMTAAVGHPTLRLLRVAIGPFSLEDLAPGEWRAIAPPAGLLSDRAIPRSASRARAPARSSSGDRPAKGRRAPGRSR